MPAQKHTMTAGERVFLSGSQGRVRKGATRKLQLAFPRVKEIPPKP
jgi:hypothetical protein